MKLLACLSALWLLPLAVFAEAPVLGKDYVTIGSLPAAHPGKPVVVTEFFSYGCPSCYRLDKSLMTWVKAQGPAIRFKRVPVIFHTGWDLYAKAYHAAQDLKLENTLSPALFNAIQEQRKSLDTTDAMVAFLKDHGVPQETATSALTHSTTINLQLMRDATLMHKFDVKLVPSIVIDGYYKTDLAMAQDEKHFFEILQALIKKSAAASPTS